MIKTVIFDLGNVIVPFDFKRGYRGIAPHCAYAPEEIPKRIGQTDLVIRLESGQIEPRDFHAELARLLEMRTTYDQFCDIWSSIFLPHTLIPDQVIEGISKRYRLLLLSNTNAIHFAMLKDAYPTLRHFHHKVLSHEVGAMKPAELIYADAVKHSGVNPEECFFTDDVLPYVEGARKYGIDAEQFLGFDKLAGDLAARGIRWE